MTLIEIEDIESITFLTQPAYKQSQWISQHQRYLTLILFLHEFKTEVFYGYWGRISILLYENMIILENFLKRSWNRTRRQGEFLLPDAKPCDVEWENEGKPTKFSYSPHFHQPELHQQWNIKILSLICIRYCSTNCNYEKIEKNVLLSISGQISGNIIQLLDGCVDIHWNCFYTLYNYFGEKSIMS